MEIKIVNHGNELIEKSVTFQKIYLDSISIPFLAAIEELLLALLFNNNVLSVSFSALIAVLRCPVHIRSVLCHKLSFDIVDLYLN